MPHSSEAACEAGSSRPPADDCLHREVELLLERENRREKNLSDEVRIDRAREVESFAAQHFERGAGEEVEERGERAVWQILDDLEPGGTDAVEQSRTIVQNGVLRRL